MKRDLINLEEKLAKIVEKHLTGARSTPLHKNQQQNRFGELAEVVWRFQNPVWR